MDGVVLLFLWRVLPSGSAARTALGWLCRGGPILPLSSVVIHLAAAGSVVDLRGKEKNGEE